MFYCYYCNGALVVFSARLDTKDYCGMEGINMEWLKKGTVEKQDQEQRVELERHSMDCIIGYIHLFLFSIR